MHIAKSYSILRYRDTEVQRYRLFTYVTSGRRTPLFAYCEAEQSRSTIFIDTLMNYPPLPDLSVFDFDYRPTIECIEEHSERCEGTENRIYVIATISISYSTLGGSLSICMKIGKRRSKYYIVDDQSDPADEKCASKEKTSTQPMSFGEFIKYLEEVVYNDNVGVMIYQSLEESNERPITYTDDVELGSDIYPELKPFYEVMIKYLVDWVNGLDELPDQEGFLECVEHFVGALPTAHS